MGLGGVSLWQLAIILLIVVLVFGTSRLKSIGSDLGGALKSFRKAMDTDDDKPSADEGTKQIESDKDSDAQFSEQTEKEQRH